MTTDLALLLACTAGTLVMTGIIWMVQLVHYPLFAAVGDDRFAAYHAAHSTRISQLILLPWGIETVTAVVLAVRPPAGVDAWLCWTGATVAVMLVVVTGAVFAPLHRRLSSGGVSATVRRLVRLNLVRTALWSAHGAIVLAALAQYAAR